MSTPSGVWCVFAIWACTGCFVLSQDENPPPVCTPEFHRGQTLRVVLDSSYDPSSDFLYDERVVNLSGMNSPSCDGVDGLGLGTEVGFGLLGPLDDTGSACTPYGATFEPEPVRNPQEIGTAVHRVPQVSIAASVTEGALPPGPTIVVRELMTPTGDAHGAPIGRQLPPLVVVRTLDWLFARERCRDAWVAAWSATP